ncbi:MAG: terminase large subunit domain-containing protein [Brevundimonas sp.]
MSWDDWHALLDRYVAGEPIRTLAAEYRTSPSSIHRNAKEFGMRKKDHRRAVYLPKGPPPVVVTRDGRELTVVCAEVAFAFDPEDPAGTERAILAQFGDAVTTGERRNGTYLGRMVFMVRRILSGGPLFGPAAAAAAAAADDDEAASAPPIELRPAQRPPGRRADGSDWSTWLFLGGRGAGKTLAGASWLADQAEALGAGGRLALVGPTLHDVREVMIEGPSGIRSLPRWSRRTRPVYEPSRRRLVFANGCVAQAFSAEDPDSLRGPQFSGAWADEFCAWPAVGARGAGETLALLRMGLRLPLAGRGEGRGARVEGDGEGQAGAADAAIASPLAPRPSLPPKLVVTTTPRPTRALIALRDEASCVLTHATTAENAAHLSAGFLEELRGLYGGTRREAQELEGRIVDLAGALFTAEMMARARVEGRGSRGEVENGTGGAREGAGLSPLAPRPSPLDRIIVALDPTTTVTGDACGIIVAGARRRADGVREAVVLADRSAAGLSPDQWGRRAVAAAVEFGAGAVVAEVNQGGDMVRAVLKTAGCSLRIREVRATRGKRVRAEPVAALYEQGRVRHAPADGVPLTALEDELMAFAGEMEGAGSLDRADALVWAVTDLLIDAPEGETGPRIRRL